MSTFDVRWQALVHRARSSPEPGATAPWGFASRVVARAAQVGEEIRLEDLWLRRARQSVSFMAAIAVVLGALELRSPRPASLAAPAVENAVSQVMWHL
ncbi:MAG: hypothetical protein J0L84_16245 [Verrucomicrobia bacterium]|nr:hypothetical protein [Verrucomicrobiota bacterium]